jgi:quercetin dioxygenase-like cupin family protein
VKIVRIYNGPDGKSTFEHVSLESHPELKTMQAAKGVQFTSWPPGHFMDFHPAPRHQLVITLQGEMEIGLEDGTTERFGPGDVLIAEDLQGKGHTLRVTGDQQRISVSVPLVD